MDAVGKIRPFTQMIGKDYRLKLERCGSCSEPERWAMAGNPDLTTGRRNAHFGVEPNYEGVSSSIRRKGQFFDTLDRSQANRRKRMRFWGVERPKILC